MLTEYSTSPEGDFIGAAIEETPISISSMFKANPCFFTKERRSLNFIGSVSVFDVYRGKPVCNDFFLQFLPEAEKQA